MGPNTLLDQAAKSPNISDDLHMADLIAGPLKGKRLKMHKTDPKTGEKTVIELGGEE